MNNSKLGRVARNSLSESQRLEFSNRICQTVNALVRDCNVVMCYNAIDSEVDVVGITAKTKVFPSVEDGNIVPKIEGKSSKIGLYNIIEPDTERYDGKIDAVIVPMCAFDRQKMRSGFGKGYYDRFLKNLDCKKIGVAFSCQEQQNIPQKSTDVKMDIIVTEKEIIN